MQPKVTLIYVAVYNVVLKVVEITLKKWIFDSKRFSIYILMEIDNRGKFHHINICGCYVKNFLKSLA